MPLRAFIPFKPVNPKSRLSRIMGEGERVRFARAMLGDVVEAVLSAGCAPVILATDASVECRGAEVQVTPLGLNDALNNLFREQESPLLIAMADMPLADSISLGKLIGSSAQVAIVPGRGGGTNALLLREPQRFRADFYGASFLKHMKIAADAGLSVEVIDSFRLHTDVDEESDLVELLIHGRGRSRALLEELGFSLSVQRGRVGVKRHAHEEARRGIDSGHA